MVVSASPLSGVFVVELDQREDERGFFARAWCKQEFASRGLATEFVQHNIAFNWKKGTLRGLHYQAEPHGEVKLIRCTRGAIFDVVVDLRSESATCGQWYGVELTAENRKMLYIPKGCAHGYQTLLGETEVFYQVSAFYQPEAERGIRWDDPTFGIKWPEAVSIVSEKDQRWPMPFSGGIVPRTGVETSAAPLETGKGREV